MTDAEKQTIADAFRRISGLRGLFLDESRGSARLYVVVEWFSTALQGEVNDAEDALLRQLPTLRLNVVVRSTQGVRKPEAVARGIRIDVE